MDISFFSNLSVNQLLDAEFGIEREGLRINQEGVLSKKPHPTVFGDKKTNPYITTDFSESQLELITPVFRKAKDAVAFLDSLYNIAVLELEEEYIWPQSMPAISPPEEEIPLAVFADQASDRTYREYLSTKYGGKKQLISGIHINFSLGGDLLDKLYRKSEKEQSFGDFKNEAYLKIARNSLRYNWLLIYLLGAANIIHKTFEDNCVASLEEISEETFSNADAVSFRNSNCGYQNKSIILPDYSSIENYVSSINSYIKDGDLKDIRELYAGIRLKGKGAYTIDNLLKNGIQYIELRTIDCNPFAKSGLMEEDLDFIHLFFLYCLTKTENTYEDWLVECEHNDKTVAVEGQSPNTVLRKNGQMIPLQLWGMEVLNEMLDLNNRLDLPFAEVLQKKIEVMLNHENTYSYQIALLCQKQGIIAAHLELAKSYKDAAYNERFRLKPYTDLELSTQILLKESIKRGISFEILDCQDNFIQLAKGDHIEYVKQATKTSKDTYVSVLAMENKTVTKKILHAHRISVPSGEEYIELQQAKEAAYKWLNKPIVIKPKSTNFGLGISVFPEGANVLDLEKALDIAFTEDTAVLIEHYVKGKEYRFLVMGEETVAVLHRVPANVIGDGKSTIAELVAIKNENPLRGKGYKTPLEKIEIDEQMKLFLHQENITVETVLPEGKLQYLRENSNISTGGDSIDVTEQAPKAFKDIAVQAAKAVGATICGVDMMIEQFENEASSYSIIELNFNPAIHIHAYPYKGIERNIGYEILKVLKFV